MTQDFKDLAQIYQQRALESLSEEDLAHAKRYRIAAELESVLRECYYELDAFWNRGLREQIKAIAKIDEVVSK